MHAPADSVPPSSPVLMRFPVRSWEYRRPRLWVGVRVACGIFNVVLGVALLASVRWLGPLTWLAALPLAGAALIFRPFTACSRTASAGCMSWPSSATWSPDQRHRCQSR